MKYLRKIMSCTFFLTITQLSYSAQNPAELTDMEEFFNEKQAIDQTRLKLKRENYENISTKPAFINYIIREYPEYKEAFYLLESNKDKEVKQSAFYRYLDQYIPDDEILPASSAFIDDFALDNLKFDIKNKIAIGMKPRILTALQNFNPTFVHTMNLSSLHFITDLSPFEPLAKLQNSKDPIIRYVIEHSGLIPESITVGEQYKSAFMQPIVREWICEWIINTQDEQDNRRTLLHKAIVNNNKIGVINLLLNAGANPNLQDKDERTALMLAIIYGRTEIIRALITLDTNLDMQDKDGNTVLILIISSFLIVTQPFKEMALFLINAHTNLDIQNKQGDTALIKSVTRNIPKITQSLINAHANLDLQRNETKFTALMIAVSANRTNAAQALINGGADITMQDRSGKTIMDYYDISPEMRAVLNLPPLLLQPSSLPQQNKTSTDQIIRTNRTPTQSLPQQNKYFANQITYANRNNK